MLFFSASIVLNSSHIIVDLHRAVYTEKKKAITVNDGYYLSQLAVREKAGALARIYYVTEKCPAHTATGQTRAHRCNTPPLTYPHLMRTTDGTVMRKNILYSLVVA